ncbi:MAG: NUDIX domain-containing protein [Patescibacteria group bacterium]
MNYSANAYFKFCPHCGAKYSRFQKKGMLRCSRCRYDFYQNSKPTVSVFLEDVQNRILLVKRAVNPKKGWWDSPGGFLEDGEEPRRGLFREIKEELGITLKEVRLLGVYMDTYRHGYDLNTLNLIYLAKIRSGALKPMDDINGYRWFRKNSIPWSRLSFRWLTKALRDLIKI